MFLRERFPGPSGGPSGTLLVASEVFEGGGKVPLRQLCRSSLSSCYRTKTLSITPFWGSGWGEALMDVDDLSCGLAFSGFLAGTQGLRRPTWACAAGALGPRAMQGGAPGARVVRAPFGASLQLRASAATMAWLLSVGHLLLSGLVPEVPLSPTLLPFQNIHIDTMLPPEFFEVLALPRMACTFTCRQQRRARRSSRQPSRPWWTRQVGIPTPPRPPRLDMSPGESGPPAQPMRCSHGSCGVASHLGSRGLSAGGALGFPCPPSPHWGSLFLCPPPAPLKVSLRSWDGTEPCWGKHAGPCAGASL